MTATSIDGNAYAADLEREVAADVAALAEKDIRPGLATVIAGDDYASRTYQRRLQQLAEKVGCHYVCEALPADVLEADAIAAVGKLDADPRVSGILVLRPLPPQVSEVAVYRALDPGKDIESVHPVNTGLLALGRPRFVPSTPAAVFHIVDRFYRDSDRDPKTVLARSVMTFVGRSDNVGKPMVFMALARNATVVSCDVHTYKAGKLYDLTAQADVLVSAAGVPRLLSGEHVKPGVLAIDVGINPVDDPVTGRTHLVGDLDFESVAERAEAVTPVPGGVGPITDAWLLRNTVRAAQMAAAAEAARGNLGF
ncbi:MAG: bifunctional 5,10-methylenetetrahydrofolate dehydrogenase/5,10-methenyltetrahydrofolate cyclohydrolase [Streptosporangiales bacterium]|nr:bifunctional 5,10-methylenetetrahydrofolate dehydrogenase/5,10-methenyltetrahydrofolate cyclohydrolase [Streptosporangiales bacterium]MBO0890013.1 bifunctional 5,10-methylenetetrahydrofolate dehydrogenase/5,10-methenyltetrahydrofolate cyclohydrolase [Acidothermales bacterium]